ncbi:MAG: hypothetical protein FIB06_08205 [Betaproteobacteria bacterium]|nr:hypothetical protein [Betaproteobacteria bacterium]
MFRKVRIAILLLVLATVALGAWRSQSRVTAWEHSIHVAVFPIAADDSPATARHVATLDAAAYADIAQWLQGESERWGRSVLQPVILHRGPTPATMPPLPPPRADMLDAITWSLKLRWWASRHDRIDGPAPAVRLFVLYHDPERTPTLPHSTGLAKGHVGVIHTFASPLQQRQNAVIIAHELLHTLGASDKYDPASGMPLWPQGYAEPEREPRLPQRHAEIMGGRIPVAPDRADIPESLADTLIGPETAREIGLLRSTR